MKVLWITGDELVHREPLLRYVLPCAAAVRELGHDATVLAPWSRHAADAGDEVRTVPASATMRAGKVAAFLHQAQEFAQTGGYDVIHSDVPVAAATAYAPIAATVPERRAADRKRWGWLGFLRSLADATDVCGSRLADCNAQMLGRPALRWLAASQLQAQAIGTLFAPDTEVAVVPPGAPGPPDEQQREDWRQEHRFRLGLKSDDLLLLAVGRRFAHHGVLDAIRAFDRWYHRRRTPGKDARLVFIGGDVVEGYQRVVGLRDLGRVVAFVPPTADVSPWFAAADAFIRLSWYEPCTLEALEAARWGLPSILSSQDGAAEMLGNAALVVPRAKCVRPAADAIAELADPARRGELVAACRACWQEFSAERWAKDLLAAWSRRAGDGEP